MKRIILFILLICAFSFNVQAELVGSLEGIDESSYSSLWRNLGSGISYILITPDGDDDLMYSVITAVESDFCTIQVGDPGVQEDVAVGEIHVINGYLIGIVEIDFNGSQCDFAWGFEVIGELPDDEDAPDDEDSSTEYPCTDSDGGIVYNTKGLTEGFREVNGNFIPDWSWDYCHPNFPNRLHEWSCSADGTTIEQTLYECPEDAPCSNGACRQFTIEKVPDHLRNQILEKLANESSSVSKEVPEEEIEKIKGTQEPDDFENAPSGPTLQVKEDVDDEKGFIGNLMDDILGWFGVGDDTASSTAEPTTWYVWQLGYEYSVGFMGSVTSNEIDLFCPDGYILTGGRVTWDLSPFFERIKGISLTCNEVRENNPDPPILESSGMTYQNWGDIQANSANAPSNLNKVLTGLTVRKRDPSPSYVMTFLFRYANLDYDQESANIMTTSTQAFSPQNAPDYYDMVGASDIVSQGCGFPPTYLQPNFPFTTMHVLTGITIQIYDNPTGSERVAGLQLRCQEIHRVQLGYSISDDG